MADIAAHVLIAVICTLLALLAGSDITVATVVGLLVAVCLAALAALVETKTWLTLSMAFCVAAVAIPTWAMFLPLVACDLAYQLVFCATPRTRHAKYVLTAAPCAAACVVTGMALMSIGGVWPHDLKDEGTDFHSMVEDAASVDEGVPLTVHLADGIEHAPAAVARCFAAVIREALTNAVRHGTASEATVKLIDLPGLWQLIVQDNGGKPISAVAMRSAGIGLADIEERARALGGNATCGPYGEGWRVFVSIPKPDPAQQTTQGA